MKAALGFVCIAGLAGLLIGFTRLSTAPLVAQNIAAKEARVIAELLEGNVDPTAHQRLCKTRIRGYAGWIDMLVLPTVRHSAEPGDTWVIEAVRVLSHRETPGIGDFIERRKSPWILNFQNQRVTGGIDNTVERWLQELDAVSGATVTRSAVIRGVAQACRSTASPNAGPSAAKSALAGQGNSTP